MTPVAAHEEGQDAGSAHEDPATDADDAPPADEPAPAEGRPRRSRLLIAALVLVVACAAFLAVSAGLWWRADHDSDRDLALARDSVLVDARRDVEVLTSLDYRKVPDGLAQWKAVSTGALATQLGRIDSATSQALADAGKVTTSQVIDIAVVDLDPSKGTASAIAAVEISVKDQSGQTEVKRDRFTVGLSRVGGRWRASALDQLPVSTP